MFKYVAVIILLLPFAVFAFAKPVKILYPEVTSVECIEEWLCVDDLTKAKEAKDLYVNALSSVESKLTKFNNKPKVVFCSSEDCFSNFGFSKSAANSIGSFGIVVAPRGWAIHYIKHELIHQWQSENLGMLSTWMTDSWIIEGMAYSVSDDPRELLSEPFETYQQQYNKLFGQLSGLELRLALENEI